MRHPQLLCRRTQLPTQHQKSVSHEVLQIKQTNYLQKLLTKYNVTKTAKTPASQDLFTFERIDAPSTDKHAYLGKVMSLMYLAILTQPDIILAVTYLASASSHPTIEHDKRLDRVLQYMLYLQQTNADGITIQPKTLQLEAYADASYNVHKDAK